MSLDDARETLRRSTEPTHFRRAFGGRRSDLERSKWQRGSVLTFSAISASSEFARQAARGSGRLTGTGLRSGCPGTSRWFNIVKRRRPSEILKSFEEKTAGLLIDDGLLLLILRLRLLLAQKPALSAS